MEYCDNDVLKKIDDYICENKNDIINDLLELVRVQSVKGEALPEAPFGEKCAEMLRKTDALFKHNGFMTDINETGGYALSYYGNGDKRIGVFTHTDVVPVDDRWQVCPPFEPIKKDGYIFGRGCNDDKSGVIQTLYAAKMIRDLDLDFNSTLVMFNGSNEESGMADLDSFVQNEPMPDVSFVPDAVYPCVCGERSILGFSIVSKKGFKYIKKFHGGEAFNIILGRLDAELAYSDELWEEICKLCDGNQRISLTKNDDTIYITSLGIPSHVMYAEKAVNAAGGIAEILSKCKALGEDREIMKNFFAFASDNIGMGFGIAHNDEHFGKLVCGNGIVRLNEHGKLQATFDCRIGMSLDIEYAEAQVLRACGDNWDYEKKAATRGYNISDDDPVIMALENIYEKLSGAKAERVRMSGGTYARKLMNAIPIGTEAPYATGEAPQLPAGHGGVHQPDEMISVSGFLEGIKILACYILATDKIINKYDQDL